MTISGLRRFANPGTAGARDRAGQARQPGQARPDQVRRQDQVAGERCEMCTEPVPDEHSHVVDLTARTVRCVCRACYLLFTAKGAAQGRYRAIPDRYRYDPRLRVTAAQWDELGVPVDLLFVFHNSGQDKYVAFYPSPAGATESLLPMATWSEILAANPDFADLRSDVEAVLLRRSGAGVAGFLVPIDACYDLVGRVRLHWRGFDGGAELWASVDAFFDRLLERAEPAGHAELADG